MTTKWNRKMILSGIVIVLIFIRHSVVGTHGDDNGRGWSHQVNQQHQQQSIHQQYLRSAQHAHPLPRHGRHHHDDYMHKSNRDFHIKSHSHIYRDRDYRPATKATTRAPTTLSWKLSSATAGNLRLPELTHISYRNGNETIAGSTIPVKNRLDNGERHQWSVNNKRNFIGPYQVKLNNDDAPTTAIKREHNLRSFWSRFKSHPHPVRQHVERHLQVQDHHDRLLGKTSTIVAVDPAGMISHEDQQFKSKTDYNEDYDEDDYYEEIDGNDEEIPKNMIEEGNSRQQKHDETEDVVSEYKIEDKSGIIENAKQDEEAESKIRDKIGLQDVEDDYNYGYVDDEPDPLNEEHNQTISLTDIKWNNLGTAEAVARTRQQHILNSPQGKVDAHIQRVKEEGKCHWPHPKVIPVIDASNRFIPHCTILHRCADDTGCCSDDKKKCVAKYTTSVELYFYVIPINQTKPSIEARKFDNHTECHCVDKNRHRRTIRHYPANTPNSFTPNERCKCPRDFNIFMSKGHCRCDCFNWNQNCNYLKEGNDSFPIEDQICISENKCQKPTCEYGHYSKHSGHCPRRITSISRKDFR